MPLETQLTNRAGRARAISWSWLDRMTLAWFVLLDGGTVGEAARWEDRGWLNMGYIGAGCEHVFTDTFGYSQTDTKETIWCRPGQTYREFRGH